jgi:hypothetical protein
MWFKAYGTMTVAQGLVFVVDLLLGLHMKVPARSMFRTQIWCTVLAFLLSILTDGSAFVNIGVVVLGNVPNVCSPTVGGLK